MTLTVNQSLDRLNSILPVYKRASGKTWPEVLEKAGSELVRRLSKVLFSIKPSISSIRDARLAALAAGQGIKLRDSLKASMRSRFAGVVEYSKSGRKLTIGALAAKEEIKLRVQGRGYLGHSVKLTLQGIAVVRRKTLSGRYRQQLATAEMNVGFVKGSGLTLTFGGTWHGQQIDSGVALNKPQFAPVIVEAVSRTIQNAAEYHRGRHLEDMQAAIDAVSRGEAA